MNQKKDVFEEMAERWESSIVARRKIGEFTGGMIAPGTMANLDSQGLGPNERVMGGRNSGYTVRALVPWLRDRFRIEGGSR